MHSPGLTHIIALARAGATDRALQLYEAGGFGSAADPAAQTVRARLLKDLAAQRSGSERRRLYGEAAEAYRRAFDMRPGTYPLINAATLTLLSGDLEESRVLAGQVLARIEAAPDEPETPFWRSATLAEALLLLRLDAEAAAALAEAVAVAPLAWEDHASTLRQFALILDAQGTDAAWLDNHRPPRSLHFGGHMSFDAAVSRRDHLDEKIASILEEEEVGFGYGALAAGADIIVAEALVERGAELHAVLPGGPEAFASVSVDPFGAAWRRRFDALLDRAATVRAVRPLGTPPDREMIGLADEIAMGAAAMNARRLESRALQLMVADAEPDEAGGHAPGTQASSGAGAWRRRIVAAPREASAAAPSVLPAKGHRRLALITVQVEAAESLEAVATQLPVAPAPALGPYFTGREIVVGYGEAAEASRVAIALRTVGAGIGGHYGAARPLRDPFGGELRVGGEAAALASAAGASAPAGTICITADFAAALAASGEAGVRTELVGELDAATGVEAVELYSLKPLL